MCPNHKQTLHKCTEKSFAKFNYELSSIFKLFPKKSEKSSEAQTKYKMCLYRREID